MCTSVTEASADSAPSKPRRRSGHTAACRICRAGMDGGRRVPTLWMLPVPVRAWSSRAARRAWAAPCGRPVAAAARAARQQHRLQPTAEWNRLSSLSACPPGPLSACLVGDEQVAHLPLNLLGHLCHAARVRLHAGTGTESSAQCTDRTAAAACAVLAGTCGHAPGAVRQAQAGGKRQGLQRRQEGRRRRRQGPLPTMQTTPRWIVSRPVPASREWWAVRGSMRVRGGARPSNLRLLTSGPEGGLARHMTVAALHMADCEAKTWWAVLCAGGLRSSGPDSSLTGLCKLRRRVAAPIGPS